VVGRCVEVCEEGGAGLGREVADVDVWGCGVCCELECEYEWDNEKNRSGGGKGRERTETQRTSNIERRVYLMKDLHCFAAGVVLVRYPFHEELRTKAGYEEGCEEEVEEHGAGR
jgi:hypothetical protein